MGQYPSTSEAPTSNPTSTSHLPADQPPSEPPPTDQPPSDPPPAYALEPYPIPDPTAVRLVGWHRSSDPPIPRPNQTHLDPSATRTPSSPTTPFDGIIDNADLEAGRGRGRKSATATVRPVQAPVPGNSGVATAINTTTTATAAAATRRRTDSSCSSNAQCCLVGASLVLGVVAACIVYIVWYIFFRKTGVKEM